MSGNVINIYPHLIPHSEKTKILFSKNRGFEFFYGGNSMVEFDSIFWLRRLRFLDKIKYKNEGSHYVDSYNSFLKNIYYYLSLNYKCINGINSRDMARQKLIQFIYANKYKLNYPNTILTDNYIQAAEFCESDKYDKIFKPIAFPLINSNNSISAIYSKKINSSIFKKEMKKCPYIYQSLINKLYDIRIIAFGNKIIAAQIESNDKYIDYKEGNYDSLVIKPYFLDSEIYEKCISLMQSIGLSFCIFDFVCDYDNNIWFLELNESAQFLFIEHYCEEIHLLDILSSFLTFKGNPFEFSKYYKDGGIRYADFYDISTKQLERMKDYDYLKGLDFCVIY